MFGLLKYLGMVLLFTIGVGQTYLYRKVKKQWGNLPVVPAEIVESKLINHSDIEGRRVYEASIRFKYQFQGTEYISDTPLLKSPQLFPDKDIEHALLAKYKIGNIINARVIPDSPKHAFLEVSTFSMLSALAIPLLVLLYALAVFGYGWIAVQMLDYKSPDRVYEGNFMERLQVNS